jgi:hypothetical protein
MRGWIALEFGAWHVAGPGIRFWFWISAQLDRAVFEAQSGDVGFVIKAIFNGSMHHNMRDGCTTRQDGGFPDEDLLEITDV